MRECDNKHFNGYMGGQCAKRAVWTTLLPCRAQGEHSVTLGLM